MEVIRSTIGWATLSWSGIEIAMLAAASTSNPITGPLPQPQLAPLDTASRKDRPPRCR